jgi:hypothetical protein
MVAVEGGLECVRHGGNEHVVQTASSATWVQLCEITVKDAMEPGQFSVGPPSC